MWTFKKMLQAHMVYGITANVNDVKAYVVLTHPVVTQSTEKNK